MYKVIIALHDSSIVGTYYFNNEQEVIDKGFCDTFTDTILHMMSKPISCGWSWENNAGDKIVCKELS